MKASGLASLNEFNRLMPRGSSTVGSRRQQTMIDLSGLNSNATANAFKGALHG
jgi:hypothetical protein